MKQLELLEAELLLLQENIERIKKYANDEDNKKYKPYNSLVVGEFKHRVTALKQRLTLVSSLTTGMLFKI